MKPIKFVYHYYGLYFFAKQTKNTTYINETLCNDKIMYLSDENYCELFCNENFEK